VRTVYLNPCGQLGGAEASLRELLSSVRAAEPGWELWLVLGEDGPFADQARELGVKVLVAPFPPALARLGDAGSRPGLGSLIRAALGSALYRRRLARLLRRLEPDIIHSNGFKMHILGAWARPRTASLVWHIHDYPGTRRVMSRLLKRYSRRCAAAIVNSHSVAQDAKRLLPDLKVVTIYNAIDLKRFAPEGTQLDLDAMAGLSPAPSGTVRVGLVGTFARWKGQKIFLQAIARLSSESPVRGYIIGGPIYQTVGSQWSLDELKDEAARLGLAGRLGFTGFVPDTSAAMRSLDIVVHASTQPEPFGMVIIEGMACGKAVIASQAGGASELFVDGVNALGHPPGDAAALAEQIQKLVGNGQLRKELGEAGRGMVNRRFYGERLALELTSLYREHCQPLDGRPTMPAQCFEAVAPQRGDAE
jgi:glycosyltransferase involved in cell wall biosynthesis